MAPSQSLALACAVGLLLSSITWELASAEKRELVGWKGETHLASRIHGTQGSVSGDEGRWVEALGWAPRAFVFHNFLSAEECDHLVQLATPEMHKSSVVDSATGQSIDSNIRTSSGMFLSRGQDETVSAIEQRIAEATFLPVDHGEGIQVLHYQVGQKYEGHYDFFHDELNTKNGGQRIATVLMYLTDVEEGGETVFPSSETNPNADDASYSPCARRGLAVKPRKGDALLFWSMRPDTELDATSLHAGCPVIKGDKWSATKWLRVGKYNI